MKLVTFTYEGREQPGLLQGETVCPLPFPDMLSVIEAPRQELEAAAVSAAGRTIPLEKVRLLAPIPRPRQDVICLGINYRAHAAEADHYNSDAFHKQEAAVPIFFSKRVNEAPGPEAIIDSHPGLVERLDYEAELAVILGREARNVPAERAAEYIFGYTVLNDVSARMLQTRHKQWYFGKSLDTFTPMGPCIVTADEIAFPPRLAITAKVNGELRQNSTTDLLITGIAEIVALLSSGMTLLPGTIIATGTPSGVGMGFDPPRFLHPGDTVECAIEGIGTLRNTVR